MTDARQKYQLDRQIKANGDGNCAFNAASLILCRVLNDIEIRLSKQKKHPDVEFKLFIDLVKPVLWPIKQDQIGKSWNEVKNGLLKLAQHSSLLQERLAPVLRELAINLIRADRREHQTGTANAIQVEFEHYADLRINRKISIAAINRNPRYKEFIGDIFVSHPFILEQFEKLCVECKDLEIAKKALVNWWIKTGGHENFLKQMSHSAENPGETDKYAGEMELHPIFCYFGIAADIVKNDRIVAKIGFQPRLPYGYSHLNYLANRGIIESKNNTLFRDLSEEKISQILNSISHAPQVLDYLDRHTDELKKNEKGEILVSPSFIRFMKTPESEQCIQQLIDRKVIIKIMQTKDLGAANSNYQPIRGGKKKRIDPIKSQLKPTYKWLYIDPEEVKSRIAETPESDLIKTIWKQQNENLVRVGLVNTGCHWNVLTAVADINTQKSRTRGQKSSLLFKKPQCIDEEKQSDSYSFGASF